MWAEPGTQEHGTLDTARPGALEPKGRAESEERVSTIFPPDCASPLAQVWLGFQG